MMRYLFIAMLVLVVGCSSSTKPKATPVIHGAIGTISAPIGTVLTDSAGKTLYRFALDTPGKSACTGTCLQYWPIVVAPATLPSSVEGVTAALGSITRADGTKQLTVTGYPMYTYVGDKDPGMTSGQGLNLSGGLWWAVSPDGAQVTKAPSSPATGGGGYGGGGGY
jgi:predicted lipoprotein with Yx(FWY)xxD motif